MLRLGRYRFQARSRTLSDFPSRSRNSSAASLPPSGSKSGILEARKRKHMAVAAVATVEERDDDDVGSDEEVSSAVTWFGRFGAEFKLNSSIGSL